MAGIYIHVPYCKTRCIYCDFYTQTNTSSRLDYVAALCREVELRRSFAGDEAIETIYFGGGTPSQLVVEDFEKIFETLQSNFNIVPDAEITMEANPDDLNDEYLESLCHLPFNRLSIGIQSFDDRELAFLKRRHSAQKARDVIGKCKQVGFDNISIDLMYGLPTQTLDIWKHNLDMALSLDIQHISSYHLIYEQGTKLYKLFKSGDVKAVDEEISIDMFSTMISRLSQAGFEQYEISNFAKDKLYSKHNSSYWVGKKYLGLGPAAHSFDGVNRSWNIASIKRYIDGIGQGIPNLEIEISDEKSRYNDFILTRMRTMWGISLSELEDRFGATMVSYCMRNAEKYIRQETVLKDEDTLKLTHKGIFISDGIMSDLMWVD